MKNPFLQYQRLKVYILEKKQYVIDTTDNNVNSVNATFHSQIEFEKDPFLKLYNNELNFSIISNLSDTATKLFVYICYNIQKDSDMIELKSSVVMEYAKIKSSTTYYKYLQELIDNAIIARRSNSDYWINPLIFFNGNRVEYYKDTCPESVDIFNITQMNETRTIRKKKQLMEIFNCKNYYQLKQKIGDSQIQKLLNKEIDIDDVEILK